MSDKSTNIHPIFKDLLQRSDKEVLLNQRSLVLWMTGLSGSGKSTVAKGVEKILHDKGFLTQVLDGDNVRTGINNNLGFSEEDRTENIRRISEISKLFVNSGIITINSFVSPTLEIRNQAREIIGKDDFYEIYINAPFEVCEERDVKGLYAKARKGEIKNFTGLDAPFEAPEQPALEVRTFEEPIERSVYKVVDFLLPLITIENKK
ncbi:MAG: adenylyl-sulfate kinase [Bacteroidetes bacterium]|nr:adenylyl-sulfate kinase [Bacteroidota bacterium]